MRASVLRRSALVVVVLALLALPSPAKAGTFEECMAFATISFGVPAPETFVAPPEAADTSMVPGLHTGPGCLVLKSSPLAKVTMSVAGIGLLSGKMTVHSAVGPEVTTTSLTCGPALDGCAVTTIVPNHIASVCEVQGVVSVAAGVYCLVEDFA